MFKGVVILEKQCSVCKEVKPIDSFYKQKSNKDGYYNTCKKCLSDKKKKQRESLTEEERKLKCQKRREQEAQKRDEHNLNRIPIKGKVCPVCGEWKLSSEYRSNKYREDGLWNFCKSCFDERYREKRNEYNREYGKTDHGKAVRKEWRDNNRDKRNRYNRNWKNRHPEAYKAMIQRTWRSRVRRLGRDAINEKQREYFKNNPDKVREYRIRYFLKHKVEIYKYQRQWDKEHPEVGRAKSQKRRARLLGNGGTFTAEEWIGICNEYDNKCLCCGEQVKLTVDHVIPISVGGSNDISNIQPLCKPCNSRKGTQTIDYRY